jgi:hypothetical protein
MSTFVNSDAKSQRAYVPTTALARCVDFDEEMLHVKVIPAIQPALKADPVIGSL